MSRMLVASLCIVAFFGFALAGTVQPVLAAPADTDPCAMLTPAQVNGALGVNLGAGQLMSPKFCQWSAAGKRLTLVFQDEHAFSVVRPPLPNVTKNTVSGVGDDAVFEIVGKFASLVVKKGSVVFVVRLYGFPLDDAMNREKAVALEVLKKS